MSDPFNRKPEAAHGWIVAERASSRDWTPHRGGALVLFVAERLEPRAFAGGMVALTPDELLVGGGTPVEDGLDASLFNDDEEEKDAFGNGDLAADPPPFWLDVAEPELAPEADPLSPAGDPDAGTLGDHGVSSFCGGDTSAVRIRIVHMGSAHEEPGAQIGAFRFTATGYNGCGPKPTSAGLTFRLTGTATKTDDYRGPLTAESVTIPITNGYGETVLTFEAVDDLLLEPVSESIFIEPLTVTTNNGFTAIVVQNDTNLVFDNEVLEVDLDIYLPGVVQAGGPLVPEADELGVGSVTFVNLDNDDADASFDNTDLRVASGDDELVRVRLRARPGGNPPEGHGRLHVTAGTADVRLWHHYTRDRAYTPGDHIPVAEFAEEGGGWWHYDVWAEGITAQTAQRATRFQMDYAVPGGLTAESSEVALTVLGVTSVAWAGRQNSRNDNATLDADPNWPAAQLPRLPVGQRVFPDARFTGGIVGVAQDRVDVTVNLSVAPPRPVTMHLRAFDVDDPSSEAVQIDDPGAATSESVTEDNRSLTPGRAGLFTEGATAGGIRAVSIGGGYAIATAEFQVTMQPGDNFRVVANADADFLLQLHNDDNLLQRPGAADAMRNTNKQLIVDGYVLAGVTGDDLSDAEVRFPSEYVSPTLTVWRFLHVERDAMEPVPAGVNTAAGTVTDFVAAGNMMTSVTVNGVDLSDTSPDVTTNPVGNGRFENGTLVVGATGPTVTSPVTSNGPSVVNMPGANLAAGLSFTATDTDAPFPDQNVGTVSSVAKVGASYVWTVVTTTEGEANWGQFVDGQLAIGGGVSMIVSAANRVAGTFTTTLCRMPFRLTDDDTVTTMHLPDDRLMAAKYRPAYIEPLSDGGGGGGASYERFDVPFSLNVAFAPGPHDAELDKPAAFESESLRAPSYWVAYVLQGFQGQQFYVDALGDTYGDGDPQVEGYFFGQTGGIKNASPFKRGSILFLETMQDVARHLGWTALQATTHQQRLMVHEVGHQFHLTPGVPEDNPGLGSIMDYPSMNDPAADPGFVGVQLHGIRNTRNPGT